MKTLKFSCLLLIGALALAACESEGAGAATDVVVEHDHGAEHEDPLHEAAEHACLHFQTGPFAPVSTGASAAEAPSISPGHSAHEVTLAGGEDVLNLNIAEHGEYIVLLTAPVAITLTDGAGAAVAPEQSPDLSEACAAIAAAHVFHLEAGIYLLSFTSDGATTDFDLIIEALAHEHDHE